MYQLNSVCNTIARMSGFACDAMEDETGTEKKLSVQRLRSLSNKQERMPVLAFDRRRNENLFLSKASLVPGRAKRDSCDKASSCFQSRPKDHLMQG